MSDLTPVSLYETNKLCLFTDEENPTIWYNTEKAVLRVYIQQYKRVTYYYLSLSAFSKQEFISIFKNYDLRLESIYSMHFTRWKNLVITK